MGNLSGVRGFLALAFVAAVGGACSNGSQTGGPTQDRPLATNRIESAPVALASAAPEASTADAGAASPSELGPSWAVASYAAAISVPPWSHCNVYPAGISNDPTRNANVQASADGTIRFYPPPQTWGTQLTLKCTLNGSSQGVFSIDLSDPSTFTLVPLASLAPTGATVVPAITGDLTTIPQADLLQGGYPSRPDPVAAPHRYAQWEQAVTKPFKKYRGIGVFDLTLQGSGYKNYEFFPGSLGFNALWAGFVQSANGFESTQSGGLFPAYNGTQYAYYEAVMNVPGVSCSSPPCSTLLWAGLGGYPINGVTTPCLLQNGIAFGGTASGGMSTALFQQLWPITNGQAYLPPTGDNIDVNDAMWVEGWTSASSNCSLSTTSHQYACFAFWDSTQGWSISGYTYQWQSGLCTWAPATAEYVAEDPKVNYFIANTYYNYTEIEGAAWDTNGTEHPDPGSGSDPNLAIGSVDTSTDNTLNYPAWPNGAYNISNPEDPIIMVWNSAQ
jgi:hypothetical protein